MPLSRDDPRSIGGYKLVDRLGSGGMGIVYLGRSRSGREVAVKVVHAQYAEDQVFRIRFRQEIAAVRRVSGAFTAPVVDADPEAARPWMVTQYVPGRSLAERVHARGPFGGAEVRRLALGLVEAIHDIHRAGVVHRDLKPANVLIAQDGPRVIDFGISRAVENQTLTGAGHVMGTPPYMSPEQFRDARSVGPASDVFSMAALLVYAATGRGPFDADSPYVTADRVLNEEPVMDGVEQPLRGILARCLAKAPEDRPELEELARQFAALPEPSPDDVATISLNGGSGPPEVVRAAVVRAGRRRLPRWLLAVTTCVLALGVTAYLALGPWDENRDTTDRAGAYQSVSPSPSASASSRWGRLPGDWSPWQTTLYETAAAGVRQAAAGEFTQGGSTCVADDGSVYCGGEGTRPVRIDATTGRTLWRATVPAGNESAKAGGYTTDIIGVRDSSVLVLEVSSWENEDWAHIVALDPDNGKRLWQHPASLGFRIVPLQGDIFVTMDEGERSMTARSVRDGNKRWTASLPANHSCYPLESDNGLYALCQPMSEDFDTWSMLIFDPDDGRSRRVAELPDGDPLGTYDGRLAFLDRTPPNEAGGAVGEDWIHTRVVLFDPDDGSRRTAKFPDAQVGEVTLVDDTLYFVRSNGQVTAVSPTTGEQLWKTQTTLERLGKPVVDDNGRTLYLASMSGRVVALDTHTGSGLWESSARTGATTSDSMAPQVLIHRGALIVNTPSGTVFTVDPGGPDKNAVPAASAF